MLDSALQDIRTYTLDRRRARQFSVTTFGFFARRSTIAYRGSIFGAQVDRLAERPDSSTVVGAIADQILRLRFDKVEVEGQLHQRDLVVIRGVDRDRKRQPMSIDDRHDFLRLFRVTSARSASALA